MSDLFTGLLCVLMLLCTGSTYNYALASFALDDIISFDPVKLGEISQYVYNQTSNISFGLYPRGSCGMIYIVDTTSMYPNTCRYDNLIVPIQYQVYLSPVTLCYYADSSNPGEFNKIDVIDIGTVEFDVEVQNPIVIDSTVPQLVFTNEGTDTNAINVEIVSDSFDQRTYGYIIKTAPLFGVLLVNSVPVTSNSTDNIVPAESILKYRPNPLYFNMASGRGGNPFLNELSVPFQICSFNNSGCPEVIELQVFPGERPDLYTNETIKIHIYVEHVLSPLVAIQSVLSNTVLNVAPLSPIRAGVSFVDNDKDVELVHVTLQLIPSDAGYVFLKDLTRDQYAGKITLTECPLTPEYATCSQVSFVGLPTQINQVTNSIHLILTPFSSMSTAVPWNRVNSDGVTYQIEAYKLNQPSVLYTKTYQLVMIDDTIALPPLIDSADRPLSELSIGLLVLSVVAFAAMAVLWIERIYSKLFGD